MVKAILLTLFAIGTFVQIKYPSLNVHGAILNLITNVLWLSAQ